VARKKASRKWFSTVADTSITAASKALADAAREADWILSMATHKRILDSTKFNLKDQVVAINRVTKVVKGGKNTELCRLVVSAIGFRSCWIRFR